MWEEGDSISFPGDTAAGTTRAWKIPPQALWHEIFLDFLGVLEISPDFPCLSHTSGMAFSPPKGAEAFL